MHGNKLIDGAELADRVKKEVAGRVAELKARGIMPGLSVVLVGDDPASTVYIGSKERTCIELGMRGETIRQPATISQDDLRMLGGAHKFLTEQFARHLAQQRDRTRRF